jgi:hypothetical protein
MASMKIAAGLGDDEDDQRIDLAEPDASAQTSPASGSAPQFEGPSGCVARAVMAVPQT